MDDFIIIKGIKSGDKNSFDMLYEKYNLILYRTAYLILGNKEDAEDVLQETFLSIYTNINSINDESKLKSWIFTILKNAAYSKYKNRKKEFPDENILFKVDCSSNESLEEDFAMKNDMAKALIKLKPKQREVLVLYYYNDFTIKEIATICSTFTGTVKSRLYKARRELKKEIENLDKHFLKEGIYE